MNASTKSSARCLQWLVVSMAMMMAPALAGAQNGPLVLVDGHFLCYKGKLAKGDAPAAPLSVSLADMFESGGFGIGKERGSCNPADKNGEGIVDAVTHLTSYQIKAEKGEPKHVKQLGVRVFNQFGIIVLDTLKVDRLLVPAAKDDEPTNPLPDPPVGSSHEVDHYKCYKVKVSKGTSKLARGLQATVEDQWETPAKTYNLKKPKLLCLAADKNGEGIKTTDASQLCYQVKPARGEPKHTKRPGVGFADSLVAHRLDSVKEELLCVPSLKDPPDQFCGDGVVNQVNEECDGDAAVCPNSPTHTCLLDCTCAPVQKRCGDGVVEPAFGEQCEVDGQCAAGESCTTSCTCMDSQCPDTMSITHFAEVGAMMTGSDNDSGFTGVAHDSEILDLTEQFYRLSAVAGSGPGSCGVATMAGYDPESRLCRCEGDNRQICDQPNEPDVDDCGGETCVCYLDTMAPTVSGNVPTCSFTKVVGEVSGSWNVDTGDGDLSLSLEQTTTLSSALLDPCASCEGDVALNDGVRDGTCDGGANDGQSCDAQSSSSAFPAPGGGSYSLDCFPEGPVIVRGLFLELNYTTGTRELDAVVPCGFMDSQLCHCGRCDNDTELACNSDTDCAAVGGECGAVSASSPLPNSCGDQTCTDLGSGQGQCLADPEHYCDALVRPDATGLIGCNTNADCAPAALGVDAGTCTLEEFRSCYPDDITVTGTPSTTAPFVVSADCVAPSPNNPAANIVAGYPGPGVRHEQLATSFRCAGDPAAFYPACP